VKEDALNGPLCIEIDYDRCVCSRICMAIAPKVFQQNMSGQTAVVDPQAEEFETIRAASEACPVSAITVKRMDTR